MCIRDRVSTQSTWEAGPEMIVVELFLEFALLSCIAFGGATALLPEMHRVVVENHHWLDDTTKVIRNTEPGGKSLQSKETEKDSERVQGETIKKAITKLLQ
eukprot:TRINITY_DN10364_c0_g1_i1.p4 TRINITY_DN10364_c0_g1~~TRINITY_DN10364_c0_g1_i1.p4  ORF type:complete len:101 (-),score=13.72 TRINITY_DN10364_c0_g1_i1:239-541(-)